MHLRDRIQNLIFKLETGGGARPLRVIVLTLLVVGLAVSYNSCAYRNISTSEGMDSAQLARNISEGKGFTTLCIRPFSLFLLQRHNQAAGTPSLTETNSDFARIKTAHPDISNPPLYPFVLAGLMKVLPFHWAVELKSYFWSDNGSFTRYEPDFLIAMFNQVLLLGMIFLVFFLARKLFDPGVAWLSVVLTIGCELFWRFSTSGLPTMLLSLIFLGLAWCVLKIEELVREPQPRHGPMLAWALAAGLLTGAGALTRYSFGWVIIPLMMFLILFSGPRRVPHILAALGAFAVVLGPWIVRNCIISGTPFGTAGYAVAEGTSLFPQFQLERSLHPDLTYAFWFTSDLHKLLVNAGGILENLPKLGGSWAGVLFLAGLLLRFRNPAPRRMRYFLLMCLVTFIVVQALGQTQLSVDSPELSSENLLVLLAPLVFVFGVSFFFTLLEQLAVPLVELRYAIMGSFVGLCCLPLIIVLLSPKANPVVYPPYFPPDIQKVCGWMNEDELMMSDVPWAVAWYGNRQCVWLTLDWQDEFSAINKLKPVRALYLTPQTMDGKFVSEWMEGSENGWGNFLLQTLNSKQVPDQFPLTVAPTGFLPERLFLTDHKRW